MKAFRFWLSVLLIRLGRWVAPSGYEGSKLIDKFATHILNSLVKEKV